MIKHILVALVLVCLVSGVGSADGYPYCYYAGNTTGVYQDTWGFYSMSSQSSGYKSSLNDLYVHFTFTSTNSYGCSIRRSLGDAQCGGGAWTTDWGWLNDGESGSTHLTASGDNSVWCVPQLYATGAKITWIVDDSPFTKSFVKGNVSCVDNTVLKIYDGSSDYITMNSTTDPNYEFEVLDNQTYQLTFYPSMHQYEFSTTGSNITYDYDACSHTKYRFEESCGNLIPDTEGWYCMDYIGGGGICNTFEASNGILDMSNVSCASITLYTNTFVGEKWWYITPVLDDHTYNIINTALDWKLKVIVQNESDGTLIDDAMVRVNQTCYCTHEGCIINPDQSCTCGGHSTRQKKTVSGTVGFSDMSLQDASLFVMKTGYKILDENTTGYSAFLSGKSNFSSKTWIVKLANSSSNNSSTFYEVPNKVDIHFRDVTGNLTSKILDTDAHVDLYYQNNNTEEEAMTLRFESSSTHTYFMPERTYTIAHDDAGYKRILNGYFTPWEYSYRAVMYNSSIYGWNITIPLTVRNGTREEEQHYQNLTTGLWFMYVSDGKIDYREDMKVAIHAGSNNSTLLNVDVELWKDGVYIACKNLTATDFTGADFPYYYVWNPVFDYVSGSNYSVRMYGFDRTLLETDYVVCETDDTTRKNKLTIGVKDRAGGNLNNCYIYLEDWGSLPTGSTYYNAYEGIDNGDYRYKATKAGYSGGGWEEVTLTDEDKIVWYVLSEDYTNTSTAAQKFTDDDIKGFFFPLMFFLLICIVLGGLKYVAS